MLQQLRLVQGLVQPTSSLSSTFLVSFRIDTLAKVTCAQPLVNNRFSPHSVRFPTIVLHDNASPLLCRMLFLRMSRLGTTMRFVKWKELQYSYRATRLPFRAILRVNSVSNQFPLDEDNKVLIRFLVSPSNLCTVNRGIRI